MIIDDYYIYCTFDEDLIEPSYIFFRSLFAHIPNIKLHVHCINFSDDNKIIFENVVNKYWKNNIEIIHEKMDVIDNLNYKNHPYERTVKNHFTALMSKIIIANRKYKKYMFHLDVDMIVLDDFSEIITDYSQEIIGHRYDIINDVINAGVMIFNIGNRDILQNFNNFIEQSQHINVGISAVPDEGYIKSLKLTIKTISSIYCGSVFSVPYINKINKIKIFHFIGNYKPFLPFKIKTNIILYMAFFKKWIDLYDTFDLNDVKSISQNVEKNRSMIVKYSHLSERLIKVKNSH